MKDLLGNHGWRISFRRQLMATIAFGILLLVIVSTITNVIFSTKDIRNRLIEEGFQATETLAAQSPLALIFQSTENIDYFAKALMAYPDILGLEIYDADHKNLLLMGPPPGLSLAQESWPEKTELIHEDGRAWYFASTVFNEAAGVDAADSPFASYGGKREPIGFVRVTMGKQALMVLSRNILRNNLIVSFGIAVLLFFILHYMTLHMTAPIKALAEKMHRAELGEEKLRAEIGGPQDIVYMQTAFNTMMEVLESRTQDLIKARDAAIESARVKGEFTTHITHELRTPLNGVIGMLELLQNTEMQAKYHSYLTIAQDSAESLLLLINDILDFSRNESGKLRLNPADFYLQEMLDDTVSLLSSQANKKGLTLGYLVDPAIPQVFYGDSDRIRQILINLVGNAVKFTSRGEVIISVTGFENDDGTQLVIKIQDTGAGINEDALNNIFSPFTQEDGSTTREFGGTGLGLTICRQLVEIMGGEISVASSKGKGSTFSVSIPLLKARNAANKSTGENTVLQGMRSLVADSSAINRILLEQMVAAWGMGTESVPKAIDVILPLITATKQARPFSYLIISQDLANETGEELFTRIIQDPMIAPLNIIVMGDELTDGAIDMVSAYAEMPLRSNQLFNCLVQCLSRDEVPYIDPSNGGAEAQHLTWPGVRILIVEDNRANQEVAKGMLEKLSCSIATASNGHEAVVAVMNENFDLVFMDCNMPYMDGYEAARQIRALETGAKHLPIIAMTANNQQSNVERCLAAGMDGCAPKPVRLDMVKATLAQWIGQGQPGPETVNAVVTVGTKDVVVKYPLNQRAVNELRENIGDAFNRMVGVFLEDIAGYVHTMKRAVGDNNMKVLADVAHTIKGNAMTFGAIGLEKACRDLEHVSQSSQIDDATQLVNHVLLEVEAVKDALFQEITPAEEIRISKGVENARILIVDDDRTMRFGIHSAIEHEGYHIFEASNGLEAVKACRNHMPDLILLDAMMPLVDGFSACNQIRNLPGGDSVPVLIVTGLEDEQSIDKAYAAGATDYIAKPVNYIVLRRRIDRLLYISRAEKYVRHLAYNDSLTGLPNRVQFVEHLKITIDRAKRTGSLIAVLFLDLNRFKMINDTMGHDVGDYLLKIVSERINECIRSNDMVARLGGDEFTVILDDLHSLDMVSNVAEKICSSLSSPVNTHGHEIFITASIGISLYPNDGLDIGAMMKHADTAMYCAKDEGAQYKFYEDGMEMEISRRLALEGDLRRALEREEFVVYYQPQIDLASGEIVAIEALVRWQHPEKGLVPPNDFIPIAEETGFIEEIGEWVLKASCRQLRSWLNQGFRPLRVAVNLSGRQLENESLVEKVAEILNETDLPASALELEITESMLMDSDKGVLPILKQLNKIGVILAIDDFGTGYSSLGKLKRFPIDVLKIDRSFVNDIATNREDLAIITGIIALAKSLDLKVVAEGVEDAEQEQILKDLHCDIMQGFYFSKPIPAAVFEQQYLRQKPKLLNDAPNVMPLHRPKNNNNQ